MKNFQPLLLLMILFSACSPKQESKQTGVAKDTAVPVVADSSSVKPVVRQTEYLTGVIGKNLNIEMTMIFENDSIKGRYRYQKNADFLTIKGTKAGQLVQFQEYDLEGNTTGMFVGAMSEDSTVTGTWKNSSGSRSFNFTLKPKSSIVSEGSVIISTKTEALYDGDCACAEILLPLATGNLYPEKLTAINNKFTSKVLLEDGECTCQGDMQMGVTSGSFEVFYNKNNLLSICYYIEYMASYPSGYSRYLNMNLNTGNYIKLNEVFKQESIPQIKERINKKLDQYFNEAIAGMESEEEKEYLLEYKERGELDDAALEKFLVNKEGITFYYSWGMPHAIQALEPAGEVSFSFAEISSWVKEDGILAFAKK